MLALFHYPASLREKVARMMETWRAFCALPEAIKVQFGYTADEHLSGAGYELKHGENGMDLKEDFHVRRDRREFLYGEANRIGAPEANIFLDAAYAIYDELDTLIAEFVREVESEYGVENLMRDVEDYKETLIIRLLHYFGDQKSGDILGSQHPDKGGFTGHLYESHPGVERLTREGNWVPMDVAEGEALFFAGFGLQNHSKGAIKAVWHRIIANDVTAKEGRWSAVCFSNIVNSRYYDKERCGRTQDLPPGLSYTQSFEEFDKLFMD
jgi:isopenicillin N synthase-like dioxygenase